jgi:adenosylmethionine-8-amino-7-oxononanoate aminotransferase
MAMLKHLTEDGLYERAAALAPHFGAGVHATFDGHRCVDDVRDLGLMAAVQLKTPPGHPVGAFAAAVMDHAWQKEDLYVRVSGDTIAFSPAFIASPEEVSRIFEGTKRAIEAVAEQMGI